MSDGLDAWRRRLSLVRAALRESSPAPVPAAPAKVAPAPAAAPPVVIPPKSAVPAVTLSVKQMRAEAKRDVRLNGPRPPTAPVEGRPRTRGDCCEGPRPCPYVACRHHTAVDVTPVGSLHVNHPEKEPGELEASCSLDVADGGARTLEEVGQVLNVTRERTRQIERAALKKLGDAVEGKFRGSCRARCAETGMQCRLPAHDARTPHRHERGAFRLVAAEGQTEFAAKRRLEVAASTRREEEAVVER